MMTILMRNNIIKRTCIEFVPAPKRKQRNTFYNFSILKKTNDVCIFDYCLRTTSIYYSDTCYCILYTKEEPF